MAASRIIGVMVVHTGRRAARALPWLRLIALLPISLFLGHTAVFMTQFGIGDDLRRAMTGGGHDGYWMAFSLVISAIAAGLLGRAVFRATRLSRRLRTVSASGASATPDLDGGWRREFRTIWPALFLATSFGFGILENLEHIAAGQAPHGLGALIGTEHPTAVPVLALVSAAIAAIGTLVRWRIRVLEARVARATQQRQRLRGPHSLAPAREWLAAVRPIGRFVVRLDAGRAPPLTA